MSASRLPPSPEQIQAFKEAIAENRYDFVRLAYIIFRFGEPGTDMEDIDLYDWQIEELARLSRHLTNPLTRFQAYRLEVSSGNGAAKTALGAIIFLCLMYTQRVRGRITANTKPQMTSVVWPEYDIWFQRALYSEYFFEKLGESIKAKDPQLGETWRLDVVTWNEATPASISGLHNKGGAILYIFEEAAGIPNNIWNYASGAMTDVDTIKVWLAFANSDDPESRFEQNMGSPDWHTRRIDTRTLSHVDPEQIAQWLREANGNEDHDDFRVRVRGLPRKSAKDSIISNELVVDALDRGAGFDVASVGRFPLILTCDPAWTGGDETTIWYVQGNYARLLEKYKLDKEKGEDHMTTYLKLCEWERDLHADLVVIDQGEGTAIKTLANAQDKWNWTLISFAGQPNDQMDVKESTYANIRAQMYYMTRDWLQEGGVLDVRDPEWRESVEKELCWTKGTRHKVTGKKLAEPKIEIKARVGKSPDVADGLVLGFARKLAERLEENQAGTNFNPNERLTGDRAMRMPEHEVDYDDEYTDVHYD